MALTSATMHRLIPGDDFEELGVHVDGEDGTKEWEGSTRNDKPLTTTLKRVT